MPGTRPPSIPIHGPQNTKISSEPPFWPWLICCILLFCGPRLGAGLAYASFAYSPREAGFTLMEDAPRRLRPLISPNNLALACRPRAAIADVLVDGVAISFS